MPVPEVVAADARSVTTALVSGRHGQDLIDRDPVGVLRACGSVLRRIHATDVSTVGLQDGRRGDGAPGQLVIVHGDFGPNNVLLDADLTVTAVLDWEFAHVGHPLEDLAWCEWIVRMHHPGSVAALPVFFEAYGAPPPPWAVRQAEMVRRCEELRDFCTRWPGQDAAVREWERRAGVTAGW